MNAVVELDPAAKKRAYKLEWQRQQRREFAAARGYSTAADRATGGNREAVLKRDGYACVKCGMTDAEHKAKWGPNRPITVDHKSKDRSDNSMGNLQTLCLVCHGSKDLIPRLRVQKSLPHKARILALRQQGQSYSQIAQATGLSIGCVWKWIQVWTGAQA